ncbi:zinc ribbon domain-containing protein [Halobaculum marinum]|uniref:Zinc-ribbon domain-containing protein n=1 Tax=Halobaculum marinum TaxID=3031996 RepID=A0ABD5WSU2_9EURY|nr:zinc ribbon domain-containing protein [Halobaculum sp. DT55]
MRQDLVLRSLLAGFALAVAPAVLVYYLAAGPMVWLATGTLVAASGLVVAYSADEPGDRDEPSPTAKTNCPDCGARVPVDDATCEYCGTDLDG